MILQRIKKALIPIYERIATYRSTEKVELSKEKNNAIMLLSPDYGNIGDLAIEQAQEAFISKNLPHYNIISINVLETYKYLRYIKKHLKEGDLLFIVGGGNFGDLYPKADFGRNFLVWYFRNYTICSFPQTMVFSDTPYGRKRLEKTVKTFTQNPSLTLVAREKISYKRMKETFTNNVLLSPDIVFSLLPQFQNKKEEGREGIVFTLRADEEKFISKEKEQSLIRFIQNQYSSITFKDTAIESSTFDLSKKRHYLLDILQTYRRASLVVTDRLHGMIFAVITGTPCIVLPNSNHKIQETYANWLSACNYITLLDDVNIEKVGETINSYLSPEFRSNYRSLTIKFTELEKYIANIAKN